jgi:hypothetical protein
VFKSFLPSKMSRPSFCVLPNHLASIVENVPVEATTEYEIFQIFAEGVDPIELFQTFAQGVDPTLIQSRVSWNGKKAEGLHGSVIRTYLGTEAPTINHGSVGMTYPL